MNQVSTRDNSEKSTSLLTIDEVGLEQLLLLFVREFVSASQEHPKDPQHHQGESDQDRRRDVIVGLEAQRAHDACEEDDDAHIPSCLAEGRVAVAVDGGVAALELQVRDEERDVHDEARQHTQQHEVFHQMLLEHKQQHIEQVTSCCHRDQRYPRGVHDRDVFLEDGREEA